MRVSWSQPRRDLTLLDALGLAGWVGFAVARFVPVARLLPFWGCPLRRATGWPCPGCGLTRVADRLAHLNVPGAWSANPLGTVAGLAFAACAVLSAVHLIGGTPVPSLSLEPKEARRLRWTLGLLFLVNYAWVVAQARLLGRT